MIKNKNRQRIWGTCNWFTNHKLFKAWNLPTADIAPGLLYVIADPGYGKSVLLRFAALSDPQLPSIHLQGDKGEASDEIAKEIKKVVDIRIAEMAKAFHLTDAEQNLMIE
ncbi:MAG: hypothetical protein Q9157_002013 [Trypethelium eluteriae]